jgi:hypothetical protein
MRAALKKSCMEAPSTSAKGAAEAPPAASTE